MEKPHRMVQIYGYSICLVSIITFLICMSTLISAIIDLSDPLHAAGWMLIGGPSLASFDNYKMDILKSTPKQDETTKAGYIPDERTLRAMYEAAKNDKIEIVKHDSNRSIIISAVLIMICVVLFIIHWKLARKFSKVEMQQAIA